MKKKKAGNNGQRSLLPPDETIQKSANKDAKSANKESKSANKESKSANKDAKSANKDAKSANKDAKSANKDEKSVNKDVKSINKDAKSFTKDTRNSNHTVSSSKEVIHDGKARKNTRLNRTSPPVLTAGQPVKTTNSFAALDHHGESDSEANSTGKSGASIAPEHSKPTNIRSKN